MIIEIDRRKMQGWSTSRAYRETGLTASSCGANRGARTGVDSLGSGVVGEDMDGCGAWFKWLSARSKTGGYK